MKEKINYYETMIQKARAIEQAYYRGETKYTPEQIDELVQAANRMEQNLAIIKTLEEELNDDSKRDYFKI